MEFVDRQDELNRLEALVAAGSGGLAVLWGRRRVGKTRLLLEWSARHQGLYTVADQSAAAVQREFLSEAVGARFSGFDSVVYPHWRSFLSRLTSEFARTGSQGPVIFDEFPHLAAADPSLASTFQNWIDGEAARAGLIVAVSGSSQRMMQGLVLDAGAPLYGRSRVMLEMTPLLPGYIQDALECADPAEAVEAYSVWGGIPRYWELASGCGENLDEAVDRCVLDPLSPLFREPERLLLEESPPAIALRPLLDSIGAGVHRGSELARRLGVPSTSLARPLARLVELGLVARETPFGESERSTKRSLYRISDPFHRFWFAVVAPNKALLTQSPAETRISLWGRFRAGLFAQTWEELCRRCVPRLHQAGSCLGRLGAWGPARRYWLGDGPEWDVVAQSLDGERLLLGEAKWRAQPLIGAEIARELHELVRKGVPPVEGAETLKPVYAIFVPRVASNGAQEADRCVVDAEVVLGSLR